MDELIQELMKRESGVDPSNALREIHNSPHLDEQGLPPTPSIFQQDPMVVGPPELGKLVQEMMRRAPMLHKRIKEVRMGPTGDAVGMLAYNDPPFLSQDYDMTNLLGLASPNRGEVSLNPKLSSRASSFDDGHNIASTLSHEFAHMAGQRHRGPIRPELKGIPSLEKKVLEGNRLSADRAGELQMLLEQRKDRGVAHPNRK